MLIAILTFFRVFLRAFQVKNIVKNHYKWTTITIPFIVISDIAIIVLVGKVGWWSLPWATVGALFGVLSAIWIHGKIVK